MKKIVIYFMALIIFSAIACKKKEKDPEPGYVLQKWSKAIEKFDYSNYSKCEAYPKSDPVFREIYRDDYFTDIMVMKVEDPDIEKIYKDHDGNSYIQRNVTFEGTAVKRSTGKPYQAVFGDVIFVKFTDGKRNSDGWLIFNRTITRIKR